MCPIHVLPGQLTMRYHYPIVSREIRPNILQRDHECSYFYTTARGHRSRTNPHQHDSQKDCRRVQNGYIHVIETRRTGRHRSHERGREFTRQGHSLQGIVILEYPEQSRSHDQQHQGCRQHNTGCRTHDTGFMNHLVIQSQHTFYLIPDSIVQKTPVIKQNREPDTPEDNQKRQNNLQPVQVANQGIVEISR